MGDRVGSGKGGIGGATASEMLMYVMVPTPCLFLGVGSTSDFIIRSGEGDWMDAVKCLTSFLAVRSVAIPAILLRRRCCGLWVLSGRLLGRLPSEGLFARRGRDWQQWNRGQVAVRGIDRIRVGKERLFEEVGERFYDRSVHCI
ncbi:unnamed protein product [Calypogeia fissa]